MAWKKVWKRSWAKLDVCLEGLKKIVDNLSWDTELLGLFSTLSIVFYVEDKKYHNVSEIGSVSVLRWMGHDKPTQLGPLERASLNHWTNPGP
jgi:hypothetical protein